MGSLKLVFGVGLFVAMALVSYKVIPPFFANYQFEDTIKQDAVQATYSSRSEEDIRNTVIKHAREYEIPLTPQQVHISRVGGFGTGTLAIEADYTVPVDLPGYSTELHFHPSTQNKGVY